MVQTSGDRGKERGNRLVANESVHSLSFSAVSTYISTSVHRSDMAEERPWWRDAVIYQVYPRSFNDTNGDGIGNIPGIIEKLDYFEALGIDALWLSPIYDSPNIDSGYDVRDYRTVMSEFGTMNDLEALIDGLHERGMGLILDMVLNHTSTEHEWFERALAD